MFISRLLLKNFRAYEGSVDIVFPVSKSPTKNVYLLGGENGAGKTSFLLALTLGLYGEASEGLAYRAGRRSHDQAYAWTLEESFNRAAAARGEDSMAVTTCFTANGDRFEIQREWWFDNGKFVEEDVRLRLNSEPLYGTQHDMSSVTGRGEAAQQLLESVLPPRAARFFLFDGEEVAALADRDLGKSVIHGLDELLGLDQVQLVARELGYIEKAERAKLRAEEGADGIDEAQRELDEAEHAYAEATSNLRSARDEHLRAEATLDQLQRSLQELFEGRDVAGVAELREQLAQLRGELQETTRQLGNLVSESLAVTPSVELLRTLVWRADDALRNRRQLELSGAVADELENLMRKVTADPIDPRLTAKQKSQLRERAAAEVRTLRVREERAPSELDGFSDSELLRLRTKATSLAGGQSLLELRDVAGRRQSLTRTIRKVEADLRTFEQSGMAAELIAQRPAAELAVDRAAAKLDQADRVASDVERRLKAANARINEVEENLAATRSGAAKASIARHARLGLERFIKEMRSRRTTALEAEISATIRGLLHRKGALAHVVIDADGGGVTLFDARRHEIAVPSAGEKELFSLSLIKGLGKLSHRDAPMVIDTPLGRLDQAHRAAIVTKFLPTASCQVIVLATDSEIYGDLYVGLRPHIAWQATLSPLDSGGVEVVQGRYFDEELS